MEQRNARKPLNQADYQMKIVTDLGVLKKPHLKTATRFAIFECTKCRAHVEYPTNNAKVALYCKPCGVESQRLKLLRPLNQSEYKMKIIQDLGTVSNGTSKAYRKAIFECTTCTKHFEARAGTTPSKVQLECIECSTKKNTQYEHPLYAIWNGIKQRCYNPKRKDYNRYGAIGVTMCDEWKDNSKSFIDWCLANGWSSELHVDKDIKCNEQQISPTIYAPHTISFVTPSRNSREATGRKIQQYSLEGEYIASYNSAIEAAEAVGKTNGNTITMICKGRGNTSYGYKWKYA